MSYTMKTKDFISSPLNDQQLMMLRLFKQPLPEKDYEQVRRLIVKLLAGKIDEEMLRLEDEKGWTKETYEKWGKEHLRTAYKNK